MRKLLYILIALGILIGSSALFIPSYLSTTTNADPIEITIPQGASLNYVSNKLYDSGVIKNKLWFKYKAKKVKVDRNIKPGNYLIPPDSTIDNIFDLLEKGVLEEPIVLTIPEGFTLYQIAERVENLGFGTKDEFIQATKKIFETGGYNFSTKDLYFEMEGYLYPDTYHFVERQTVDDIANHLVQTTNNIFTEEYKNKADELNLSIHEVLTIASLIEREAKHDAEKSTISGVIHNRLNINMPLQIDASVIYGVGKGKEHNSDIYQSDLNKKAPFNTYQIDGLPPGPIASPSQTSIVAALYPDNHEYLYYVLSPEEDGHVFSKTHDEHLVNVAKYRNRNN